jgi:hypothetical protein
MDTNETPGRVPTARQIAHLRDAGRMSDEEAAALEAAETDEARVRVMTGLRSRHAAARLEAAVAAGDISAEDAERLVAEVRDGDHSAELRRRINEATRGPSARTPRE